MKENCLGQMSNVGDFIRYSKSMGGRAEQGAGGERNGNFSRKEAEEGRGPGFLFLWGTPGSLFPDYWGLFIKKLEVSPIVLGRVCLLPPCHFHGGRSGFEMIFFLV